MSNTSPNTACYIDLRSPLASDDKLKIEELIAGRDYRAILVRRVGNALYCPSGIVVPAQLKGLTANFLSEICGIIGLDGICYDKGGEIDFLMIDGLPCNKRVQWWPATKTYAVYQNGHGIWASINGKVLQDGPFFH